MRKIFSLLLAACLLLSGSCALAACDVCGGDGKCDSCLGMGFVMARLYGSEELVQIGCANPACDNGLCTACAAEEQEAPVPAATPEPSCEPTPKPAAKDSDPYTFACYPVERAVRKRLNRTRSSVTLGDLKKLTDLSIDSSTSDVTLQDLVHMPGLTELTVDAYSVDLAGLETLENLTTLELKVRQPIVNPQALAQLPHLDVLELRGDGAGKKELPYLSQIAGLRRLVVQSEQIKDLSWCEGMNELQSLQIISNSLTNIAGVEKLPKLNNLLLRCTKLESVEALAQIPHSFRIEEPAVLAKRHDMSGLLGRGLNGPTTYSIKPGTDRTYLFDEWYPEYCEKNGIDLAALCEKRGIDLPKILGGMDELTAAANLAAQPTPPPSGVYDFADSAVQAAVLKQLKRAEGETVMQEELEQIEYLFIELGLFPVSLEDLAFMPNLKSLSVQNLSLSKHEVDLAPLESCTKLERLTLGLQQNDDLANMQVLPSLTHVKELSINCPNLTDEDVSVIGQMPQLEILYVSGSAAVTDISWIENNRALREVTVRKTGITRADGLSALEHLEKVVIDQNAGQPDLSFLLGRGLKTDPMLFGGNFDLWYDTLEPLETPVPEYDGEYIPFGDSTDLYVDPRGGVRQSWGGQTH